MKSSRSRTSRRCGNGSRSKSKSKSSTRRSKQGNLMAIDLNVAKRIVKEACIDAVCASGLDTKGKSSSHSVTDESDNSRRSSSEIEFTEFVSSTISEAIASIGPQMKNKSRGKLPQRSRKRTRSVESKVKGLEYAESLHTMCSLFPVMMASAETTPQQGNEKKQATSDNSVAGFDSHRDDEEPASTSGYHDEEPASTSGYASSPESKNTSNGHPSNHNSLLPPMGAPSTTTTPMRLVVEEGMCVDKPELSVTKAIPFSPPKQQQQCPKIAKALPRSVMNGNADISFPQMLPSSSHSKPNGLLSHRRHIEKMVDINNIHDHDDDCNYDGPLIGVFGDDEGSGLVNHTSSCNNYSGFPNDGGADAVIQFAKVGSVILLKTLPVDTANR